MLPDIYDHRTGEQNVRKDDYNFIIFRSFLSQIQKPRISISVGVTNYIILILLAISFILLLFPTHPSVIKGRNLLFIM